MSVTEPLLLPEKSRLFYIGPPKTGTTSLQEAARAARSQLYEHGVYYPGSHRNHRAAVAGLLQRPVRVLGGRRIPPGTPPSEANQSPPESEWWALMEDLDSEPSRRKLVTHEFAAGATIVQARRFVQSLGVGRTHIAITLRPLSAVLVSHWLQDLKGGDSSAFESWLTQLFDGPAPAIPTLPRKFDHAGLVKRWAQVAGPENVTAVVVGTTNKDLLTDAFEEMLGLPAQTLTGLVSGGKSTNRSMSLPEANVIRQVNELVYSTEAMSWPVYRDVMLRGAINRILDNRHPTADEPRVRLPEWAAERAMHTGKAYADQIAASGVRIVGDLSTLYAEPPIAAGNQEDDGLIPPDIAVEALTGAFHGSAKYERQLAKQLTQAQKPTTASNQLSAAERPSGAAGAHTTRDLLRAVRVRLKHKLRTGKSMPLN